MRSQPSKSRIRIEWETPHPIRGDHRVESSAQRFSSADGERNTSAIMTDTIRAVGSSALVRAFARSRKDGWPRCPKCGRRLRPYEGNMRDAGTARPQQWQCDNHFIPSYWGTAAKLVNDLNGPNVPALAQPDDHNKPSNT